MRSSRSKISPSQVGPPQLAISVVGAAFAKSWLTMFGVAVVVFVLIGAARWLLAASLGPDANLH